MNEHVVSFFDSVISKQKTADIPIEILLNDIRNGKWAKQILKIRSTADKKERDLLKRKLPASTISCTTNGSHKASDVLCHSGLIQVDIDDIKPTGCLSIKRRTIKGSSYSFMFFISQ